MDAKCGDWVVNAPPRQAVEINALWYNALVVSANWLRALERGGDAAALDARARQVRESFNARFWNEEGGHLHDVIDGPDGKTDSALRPNQLIAISLSHPVLDRARWPSVLGVVERTLADARGPALTGAGQPGLLPPTITAICATRDSAYHQGTVWSWLIGPYVDAVLRADPRESGQGPRVAARPRRHAMKGCLGQIAEVFRRRAALRAPWLASRRRGARPSGCAPSTASPRLRARPPSIAHDR